MLRIREKELEVECVCGCSLLHLASMKLGKTHSDIYCDIDTYKLYSDKGRKLKSPKLIGGVALKTKEIKQIIKFLERAL
jgi:hypothetical protein